TIPQRDMILPDAHLQIPWKVIYVSDRLLGMPLRDTKLIVAVYHKSDPNKAIFVGEQQLRVTENEEKNATVDNKSGVSPIPPATSVPCNLSNLNWYDFDLAWSDSIDKIIMFTNDKAILGFTAQNCKDTIVTYDIIAYKDWFKDEGTIVKTASTLIKENNENIRVPIVLQKPSINENKFSFRLKINGVQQGRRSYYIGRR
ncbi:MAG: hypothetical protein Q8L34_00960, partial [Candidatus Woesearchaeota archaeon]|nr:hypothetical protein [Candidatus Woesearchaeota archaeon]